MSERTIARRRLAARHLLASLALVLPLGALYFFWYPTQWRPFVGGEAIVVLGLVGILLGPVLSFMVYKDNRKLLTLDLSILACLQVMACVASGYALYRGRPVAIVFVKDDFRIVRQMDLVEEDEPVTGKSASPVGEFLEPPAWTGAMYADEANVRDRQIQAELFEGEAIEERRSAYVPLDRLAVDVASNTRNMTALQPFNEAERIRRETLSYPRAAGWLPLKGYASDGVVLVDGQGKPLAAVRLKPWD